MPGSSLPKTEESRIRRFIPAEPVLDIDAPTLSDDFYTWPVDWASTGLVAVALSGSLHIIGASDVNSETSRPCNVIDLGDYYEDSISSVGWANNGATLATGCSNGEVKVYDMNHERRLCTMHAQKSQVACLAWSVDSEHILSSGSIKGTLATLDLRARDVMVSSLRAHGSSAVCGLAWSPDGRYLASGGGDGLVKLWQLNKVASGDDCAQIIDKPTATFTLHKVCKKLSVFCSPAVTD